MGNISDKLLCVFHLVAGAGLIVTAAVLSATGHNSGLLDAMFGAGAALLPTAPSALIKMGLSHPIAVAANTPAPPQQ